MRLSTLPDNRLATGGGQGKNHLPLLIISRLPLQYLVHAAKAAETDILIAEAAISYTGRSDRHGDSLCMDYLTDRVVN